MENDLITIVVPVYKVEKYINRCVDSVINQTYKNIEIILVDDGSPDNCPQICDKYAKKDKRIKVIHKTNGGLSDARNVGIENAKGKYISFVDSDDWISSDAIELLYKCLKENDADISSGLIKEVYNEKKDLDDKEIEIGVYETEEAIEKLMYLHEFSNSASGKLYKIELFENIKYPVGKYYEDLGTTYKIFSICKKIVSFNKNIYYYFQNNSSIMHKKYTKKRLEGFEFSKEQLEYVKINYPKIIPSAVYRLFYECLSCLNDMPYICAEKKIIKEYIRKYRKQVLKDKKIYKKQRLLCISSIFGQTGIKLTFLIKSFMKR